MPFSRVSWAAGTQDPKDGLVRRIAHESHALARPKKSQSKRCAGSFLPVCPEPGCQSRCPSAAPRNFPKPPSETCEAPWRSLQEKGYPKAEVSTRRRSLRESSSERCRRRWTPRRGHPTSKAKAPSRRENCQRHVLSAARSEGRRCDWILIADDLAPRKLYHQLPSVTRGAGLKVNRHCFCARLCLASRLRQV